MQNAEFTTHVEEPLAAVEKLHLAGPPQLNVHVEQLRAFESFDLPRGREVFARTILDVPDTAQSHAFLEVITLRACLIQRTSTN